MLPRLNVFQGSMLWFDVIENKNATGLHSAICSVYCINFYIVQEELAGRGSAEIGRTQQANHKSRNSYKPSNSKSCNKICGWHLGPKSSSKRACSRSGMHVFKSLLWMHLLLVRRSQHVGLCVGTMYVLYQVTTTYMMVEKNFNFEWVHVKVNFIGKNYECIVMNLIWEDT